MQITFDPTNPEECAAVADVLEALGNGAAEATPAPAKRAPAKKAAPAKRAAAKPDPEPEEDGPTLEDAVARAQELVGEKRTDEVKAAIAEIGVERVSKLKGDQIATFLEMVADEESVV